MKNIRISSFAIAVLVFALSGCGGGGGSSSSSAAPGAPLDAGGTGVTLTPIQNAGAGAVFSNAVAINDGGQVIGFAETGAGSTFKAALWSVDASGAATATPVALKPIGLNAFSAAFDLDEDGVAVGVSQDGAAFVAVVWPTAAAEPVKLPALSVGGNSAAYGISADGSIIVGEAQDAALVTRAVLWRVNAQGGASAPELLPVGIFTRVTGEGTLLSQYSAGNDVNAAGEIAGEVEDGEGVLHAVLWQPTAAGAYAAVDLRTGGEAGSAAFAVNAAGQVVGEAETAGGIFVPALWAKGAEGEYRRTNLAAAGSAQGINAVGRIAGWETGATDVGTVWNAANLNSKTALFASESQAYDINSNNLVVGRNGSAGFIKRIN